MKKTILLLSGCLFYFGGVFCQDARFTGYATGIVKEDYIECNAYGYRDKERNISYDSVTIQPVGSVSKVVIGLAIMKAQELGYLNLDEDINKYLRFSITNPNVKDAKPITLRHLATHTSGINDNERFYEQAYSTNLLPPADLEEFLRSYLLKSGRRYSKKNFGERKAGEEYSYSNIGAALAAYIVECASKMPFDQFTSKYIFEPLGMTHTHWFYDTTRLSNYARLYDEKDMPLAFYTLATYPEGALLHEHFFFGQRRLLIT
jgi:CubicO group peptidase (beta-lactamase class C family)